MKREELQKQLNNLIYQYGRYSLRKDEIIKELSEIDKLMEQTHNQIGQITSMIKDLPEKPEEKEEE